MSLGIGPHSAAKPKLPLWNTISRSYSTWFNNFPDVLRISWLWLVVASLTSWMQWSHVGEVMTDLRRGIPLQMSSPEAKWVIYAGGLVGLLGAVSIAVAWHRRVILNEQPGFSGSNVLTASLWRYVGVGLVISLIAFVPTFLIIFLLILILVPLLSHGAAGHPLSWIVILIPVTVLLFYVAAIAVMLRLSPLLPARAAGDAKSTFTDAWRRTRGNTWRIFWGLLACTLPLTIVIQVVFGLLSGFPSLQLITGAVPASSSRLIIGNTMSTICSMLTWPIAVNFLSLAYTHFFRRDEVEVFR